MALEPPSGKVRNNADAKRAAAGSEPRPGLWILVRYLYTPVQRRIAAVQARIPGGVQRWTGNGFVPGIYWYELILAGGSGG